VHLWLERLVQGSGSAGSFAATIDASLAVAMFQMVQNKRSIEAWRVGCSSGIRWFRR